MFVIYNGTVPLAVIQFDGNQIKVGVPAPLTVREFAPAQLPVAAQEDSSTPRPWKLPVPSLN